MKHDDKPRWVIVSENASINGMKGPRTAMVRMVREHGAQATSKVIPFVPKAG